MTFWTFACEVLGSLAPWSAADGGATPAWAWIALGSMLGLAVGFWCGVSLAKLVVHRQVAAKLRLLERIANRGAKKFPNRPPDK